MANRGTITYNGTTISTEDRDGSFAITYNGSTIATVGAGQTKTLNCAGQVMKTNVVIGGKTLNCAKYKMATNVVVSVVSLFPSAPSAYNLIGTYTASQTWTAPESGYFQIELFGASGNGASSKGSYSGGGGGGGGYACSRIKLNKGDTIALSVGAVGATTIAVINSSIETYSSPQVTSGKSGPYSSLQSWPGCDGGVASGGNYSNQNGGKGGDGSEASGMGSSGADGGIGANGAPNGGRGEDRSGLLVKNPRPAESGSAGFIKIYRGNTN